MATQFLEPGGDATFDTNIWPAAQGSPAVATDFVHGGHIKSMKYRAANQDYLIGSNFVTDAGGRISFWAYFNALPTGSTGVFFASEQTGDGAVVFGLGLSTGGALQLLNSALSQIGSNGATLATGAWNRISIAWTITSGSVNTLKIFVNGTISITVTNATLANITSADFIIGNPGTNAGMDLRTSDHYVDNSTALTDPGNIWVTAKRPFTNGTTIGFTTQVGSGGSGYGSGHTPQENERPESATNGWSITSAGSAITEEYNIEGQSVGDINIAGSTIVDYMGWVFTKALIAETGKIIVNGVSTNISITTSGKIFRQIAGSSTYPAGTGSDIGEITSTTVTTVSLYECGIIVAYIPGALTSSLLPQTINQPIIANDLQIV